MYVQSENAVQAGTPMTATGDVSLLPFAGAGRLYQYFICSEISPGGPGGRRPPGRVINARGPA